MTYICKICKGASTLFVGLVGGKGDSMTLESYRPIDESVKLDVFAQEGNPTWLHRMDVEKSKVGNVDIIKASREFEWGRLYDYFFRGESNFYRLEHISEDFIREIITNGKW
jgi:hypothetical protein